MQNAVFRVAAVILGQGTSLRTGPPSKQIADACTLELVSLEPGSVALALDLKKRDQTTVFGAPHLGEQALERLINGVEVLEEPDAPLPAGYDTGVLCSWRDTGRMLERGVDRMSFQLRTRTTQKAMVFNRTVKERIAARLQEPVHNKRVIEGRLLMGDFKETGYQCRIHPPLGVPVRCTFDEAHRNTVLNALAKPVRVVGEAIEKDGRIVSLQIADIETLEEVETTTISGSSQ